MIKALRKKMGYYLLASYRRKSVDRLLSEHSSLYQGIVLDIGGRDRAKFRSPKDKVEKWITADIEVSRKPDLVLDVAKMDIISDANIDVINAIELFEHVAKIDCGLKECHRVLKTGGIMLISVPFLYPVHADPFDFQRWTEQKWKQELQNRGFKIEKMIVMGRFFTVQCDMIKFLIKSLPWPLKPFGFALSPLLDFLVMLDNKNYVKQNNFLNKFHGGYFIIAQKTV